MGSYHFEVVDSSNSSKLMDAVAGQRLVQGSRAVPLLLCEPITLLLHSVITGKEA